MSVDAVTLVMQSPQETESLGRRLGERLWPGAFVALVGDLGAGKTVLATGILAGLGVARSGGSPTFPLLWEYHGGRLPAYHWDAYRVQDPRELGDLGYRDSFYGDGVCLVEWADRVRDLWPADHLLVELGPAAGDPGARRVRLVPAGPRYGALAKELQHAHPGL